MKSILLTSTALVLVAGIAAADGHASLSWSGSATAGLARDGAVKAVTEDASDTATAAADFAAATTTVVASGATAAAVKADIADEIATLEATLAALVPSARAANAATASLAAMNVIKDAFDHTAASAAVKAGDFKAYSEINTTATGTVTAGGVTVSVGMSVDAGEGYDFANDDTFDIRKAGTVGLDSVSIDMGTMGKLTLDQDAVAHLVDGDDDGAADVKYSNTFAGVAVDVAVDLDKADVDDGAVAESLTRTLATGLAGDIAYVKGTPADVQWSAKASMPIGAGSVFVAMDEEKGNHFGGSTTLSGVAVSFDSKIEALGAKIKGKRSNTLGLSYAMGSVTVGGSYNSLKDGDQWGVSASYAAGDVTLSASTDEGSDWSVEGGYALGAGASVKAGVNYTEDAFLGLSFAF